jgi:hypothetical protein
MPFKRDRWIKAAHRKYETDVMLLGMKNAGEKEQKSLSRQTRSLQNDVKAQNMARRRCGRVLQTPLEISVEQNYLR